MKPSQTVHLLYWRSDYGDEGDGYDFTAAFTADEAAGRAARAWKPPAGFSARGGYEVVSLPLDEAESTVRAMAAER